MSATEKQPVKSIREGTTLVVVANQQHIFNTLLKDFPDLKILGAAHTHRVEEEQRMVDSVYIFDKPNAATLNAFINRLRENDFYVKLKALSDG